MEILLAIALILVSSVSVNSSTKFEWIYPINFTDVTSEAYVYTSILSKTYLERFFLTEATIDKLVDEVFITPTGCRKTDKRCHELQENVKKFTKQELESIIFEMRNILDDHIRRHKRFIDPITLGVGFVVTLGVSAAASFIERHWLDVDTTKNINKLMQANTAKELQINDIHKTLDKQLREIANLSLDLNGRLEDIKMELAKFVDETTFRSLLWNQVTQLMFHYDKIHDSCNRRVIPSNSVDSNTLDEDLEELEKALLQIKLALAIPRKNIQDYYKVRICSCRFSDDAISITVQIPVKPLNSAYRLFSPIYLPFKFGDQICSIQAHDALLIEDTYTAKVQVSSAQYLKDCDLATHLCKLPSIRDHNIDSLCLQETFLEKNVTELRKFCPFVCTPTPIDRPLINQLKGNEYVITNIPDNTYVEDDRGRTKLPNTNLDGAFKLDLSCSSRLVHYKSKPTPPETLIDVDPVCKSERDYVIEMESHTLERVIPLQWIANATGRTATLLTQWKDSTLIYSFMPERETNAPRQTAIANKSRRHTRADDPYTTHRSIFSFFTDKPINNNVVYLGICFCNLIAVFFLYLQNRSMKKEFQQMMKTGSISRTEDRIALLPTKFQENFMDYEKYT